MMNKSFLLFFLSLFLVLIGSCKKELPNESKNNQPPSTRLWIFSETELRETISRQHVRFYGEDPDGFISGFLVAVVEDSLSLFTQIPVPDTLTYSWTTENDSIIALPLFTKRDKFVIIVRAVDNRFSALLLQNHAVVKGFPNPYWDKDNNGVFSNGDVYLENLAQAADPGGAIQRFPIVNTPPRVQFAQTPGDNPVTIEQPETTFTATTFAWVGSDNDGNQTLKSYRLALNDTTDPSNWLELQSPAATKVLKPNEADTVKITFYVKRQDSDNAGSTVDAEIYTGLFGNMQFRGKIKNLKLDAENVLYLQVQDIAGDFSAPARMPSSASTKWFVKKPKSRMLVVGDYSLTSSNRAWIMNYYRTIFANPSILNGQLQNFDEFGFDRAKSTNYTYFLNPAFIKTLQLYDVVLWFTDVSPNINAAQIGLFYYTNILNTERNTYGRTIFTTQYQISPTYDELRKYNDFAPLDSTSTEGRFGYNRLPVKDQTTNVNTRIVPIAAGYPTLYSDSVTTGGIVLTSTGQHTAFYKKLYKRTDSQYIYKIDSSRTHPPSYEGQLEIGIIDNQKRFVMVGLPLHLLNGWEHNLPLFFKKVIEDEFGLQ